MSESARGGEEGEEALGALGEPEAEIQAEVLLEADEDVVGDLGEQVLPRRLPTWLRRRMEWAENNGQHAD